MIIQGMHYLFLVYCWMLVYQTHETLLDHSDPKTACGQKTALKLQQTIIKALDIPHGLQMETIYSILYSISFMNLLY